jgi:uncharacterized membrane protein
MMWFIGLIVGLILGSLSGSIGRTIEGGVLGLIVGILYDRHYTNRRTPLDKRVEALEAEVRKLATQLAALQADRQTVSESKPELITPPIANIEPDQSGTVEIISTHQQANELGVPVATTAPPSQETVHSKKELQWPQYESAGSSPWPIGDHWLTNLLKGNILAKIGVVILFFGIASGLKLAVDMGLFPVSVRLMLGALAAIDMWFFGYQRAQRPEHQMFGQAMQGGGMGVLYLLVYFMLARYHLIDETLAFVLFTAIGVVGVLLAARQDARSLAALGISGAFLSPVLAASSDGNQITLFSYFLLLNLFIISVNWFKGWRELNIAGFIFTLVIGMGWAFHSYQTSDFPVSETFLILFFLLYSATPVLFNLFNAPGRPSWGDGMLLYGTPLAAAALQNHLLSGQDLTLAWNACVAGGYYLLLWHFISRKPDEETIWLEKSLLGIAIGFFTLSVPLASDAQLTAAFWTLEGFGVLYLGVKQQRFLARLSGSALQVLAGVYFLAHAQELQRNVPIFNDWFIGCLIVVVAAFSSALLLHGAGGTSSSGEKTTALAAHFKTEDWARIFLYWAMLWWFGAGFSEIEYFTPGDYKIVVMLGLCVPSFTLLEWLGTRRHWPAMRQTSMLLLFALLAATYATFRWDGHALYGFMLFVVPLAVVTEYWLLHRHDRDGINAATQLRHALGYWFLLALTGSELAWASGRLAPGNLLWPWLAWGVVGAGGILVVMRGSKLEIWPFTKLRAWYLDTLQTPVVLALLIWLGYGNLELSGDGGGLPYLPVLNPFDLAQMLALYAVWVWMRAWNKSLMPLVYGLAFLGISAEAARLAHHWGGVPFEAHTLFASSMLQALLSLLWTAIAMSAMVYASRTAQRSLWFGGFGLLAIVGVKLIMVDLANKGSVLWTVSLIGIALLILAASYFSPLPPEEKNKPAPE